MVVLVEDNCTYCGTPVQHGITTQYVAELDAEICAVCEHPVAE